MKRIVKKIVAAFVAATMATTMVMSAGAYSASYLGQTTESTTTHRYYISCYEVGSVTYGNVNGTAWTRTSTVASIMNPNYAFEGQIHIINYCGSTMSENHATFSDGISCSLNGVAAGTTVKSTHAFTSNTYGNFSRTLTANI